MKTICMIAGVALLTATGAIAKDKDPGDANAKAGKKICRSERVTGSLVQSTTICMTEDEWHRVSANTKDDVEKIQRNGSISTARGGLGG